MNKHFEYDFAISYAGEDLSIAEEIKKRILEFKDDYTVFLASDEQEKLIGVDGEGIFENLFLRAKQVIVLISKNYKRKSWTRFEWDIILKRSKENRYIPIRLDDSLILGLSSNIFYISYKQENLHAIIDTCVKKLILFEKSLDIHRPTEYEKAVFKITNESKGATSKAYQLVKNKRKRIPLESIEITEEVDPCYYVNQLEWHDVSTIKRLSINITVPAGLSKEELRLNLIHCAISNFNEHKPDALMVLAKCKELNDDDFLSNAAEAIFAPFGEWDKAEEGFAYDIPSTDFEFKFEFRQNYLNIQNSS